MIGGNNRARTCDPLLVRQVLSQLSYAPHSKSLRRTTRVIIQKNSLCVNHFFDFFRKILKVGRSSLPALPELGDHIAQLVGGEGLHPVAELAGELRAALLGNDLLQLL